MQLRLQRENQVDYQVERHNSDWPDHVIRANITGALVAALAPKSVIDPACGDGTIVLAADHIFPITDATLTDISEQNIRSLNVRSDIPPLWYLGKMDIEECLFARRGYEVVVLTEILEHVEDPSAILALARQTATYLVASSPEMRVNQLDGNPEHLWQWDGDGYYKLLVDAGWQPFQKTHLAFPEREYDFGIWVAR